MEQVSTIGLDIAKNVFQVHGIDETGGSVVRRQLRRRQVLAFLGRFSPQYCDGVRAVCKRSWPTHAFGVAASFDVMKRIILLGISLSCFSTYQCIQTRLFA